MTYYSTQPSGPKTPPRSLEQVRWNAKHDAYRPTTDFVDLMKIIASYYEMYSRACTFIGPYIAKQSGNTIFFPPDKDVIKEALGRDRPTLGFRAKSAFIEALITHVMHHKGKKTLISPSPSSHHSAQFPLGTFSIERVGLPVVLRDDKGPFTETSGPLHRIYFEGSPDPVYVMDLKIPPEQVKFIILRPKLGKLGTPSPSRWEVLLYKQPHGYLIDHVDSDLNPRWSGIL